jgi:hypothetical protein
MYQINDDLSIYVTRGDTVYLQITAANEETGENHRFQAGDVVRFKVYGKKDAEAVALQKDFPITEDTDTVNIVLDEQDTKIGEVISKHKDYWYEVELNPFTNPQTIIGYDEDGAKVFRLFPEGRDLTELEPDIQPEDVPVVDRELDMLSKRPVENQAIARAIVELKAGYEETEEALAVEQSRIDSFVAGATAGDEELVDIRVRADGTTYATAGGATRAIDKDLKSISAGATGTTHLLKDVNKCVEWEDGSTIEDYIFNGAVSFPSAWNDWGIASPELNIDSGKLLRIEFDLTHSNSLGGYDIRVYVANGLGTSKPFKQAYMLNKDGHYNLTVDPAYYSVYNGVDIKRVWIVQKSIKDSTASETVVKNLHIYQNALMDSGFTDSASDALLEYIKAVDSAPKNEAVNYMVSPTGEKYVSQVDANGNMSVAPVFPENALFLGNSLLLGFKEYGMAASMAGRDYFNLVGNAIRKVKPEYVANRLQANPWEGCTTVEAQDKYLNNTVKPMLGNDLELVVVQLGDNVNTDDRKAVFAEGAKNLLKFIRINCPKARVAWVGAWYSDAEKQAVMKNSCELTGSVFVNIWDLNTIENQSVVGNTYTMSDGTVNVIADAGVASHPSDDGMKAIANRILYALGISDVEDYYG